LNCVAARQRVETDTTGEVTDDRSICHVPAVPGGRRWARSGARPRLRLLGADAAGLAQSKASHHLRVLHEAGLVRDKRRGTWGFSTLDAESARGLLAELAARLGA
jgi:DNA-binding transcriptional ArsR family regulator